MRAIPRAACLLFLIFVPAEGEPASSPPVAVKVSWAYDGVPQGMRLFEPKPGDWPLWQTQVSAELADAPVAREIKGSTILLHPGGKRKFALVYRNATDKTLYFFAAPHHAEPAQATLGFKFKCTWWPSAPSAANDSGRE